MWRWGISSKAALLALALAVATAAPASSKVFLTLDEALELAFPGCEVERSTVYLTPVQLDGARRLAGVPVDQRIVRPYVATCKGKPAGVAYFDAHRVRTLPETLMVVVDPRGRVKRIEVLSFQEPEDYLPRGIWYEQFLNRGLTDELNLKRHIRGVTGATLTARATTEAVRRVLALHLILQEKDPP